MKVISRVGSSCVIEDKNGILWLTIRKKLKKDSRRQVRTNKSIFYFPIKKLT